MGLGAPGEFVETLEGLANAHHANMAVDVIRAYHFGARFIVEVCCTMPPCSLELFAALKDSSRTCVPKMAL